MKMREPDPENILDGSPYAYRRSMLTDALKGVAFNKQKCLDFSQTVSLLCILFNSAEDFRRAVRVDGSREKTFREEIMANGYSLLSKYSPYLVTLKNNATENIFITSPYGFHIGWRDPEEVAKLDVSTMFTTMVDKLTEGEYTVMSKFTNRQDFVTVRHNVCGRIFEVKAEKLLTSQEKLCICEKHISFS